MGRLQEQLLGRIHRSLLVDFSVSFGVALVVVVAPALALINVPRSSCS
jgi:hypothetical protein